MRRAPAVLIAAAVLAVAGCGKVAGRLDGPPGSAPGSPPPAQVHTPNVGPVALAVTNAAKPVGPARTVQPVPEGDQALTAASVTQVHAIVGGGKIFSTAGGDPAVNGLYPYLALYQDNATGWRVFQIGDFESWRVVEQAPGRVVLHVVTGFIDQATGTAGRADSKLIVQFAGESATSITVTPAG